MPAELLTHAFADLRQTTAPARVRTWGGFDGYERNATGLYVPAAAVVSAYPTAIDLFAGCGGFSLGFHKAGFHVVGALEWDTDAAMTYLVNLGDPTTRIYVPDPERRRHLVQRNDKERKRAGKVRTVVVDGKRTQWIYPDGALTEDGRDKGALQHEPFVDHGEYLTWPSAGQAYLTSSRRQRAGLQPNPPEYGSGYVQDLNTVKPEECLEPVKVFWLADARQMTGADILASLGAERGCIDAVMGGPPCQGFSLAGRRNVYDERNSLVFDFIRLVCEIRPKAWVMENVPGLASMVTRDGELVVDAVCRIAEEGGMGARDNLRQMLEATSGVGVAQRGVRRGGEDVQDGESRSERRRRLRDERKAIKRETAAVAAAGADGATYLQDDLFAEAR